MKSRQASLRRRGPGSAPRRSFHIRGRWLAALAALALVACDRGDAELAPPPPPDVTVARPVHREISLDLEATGTVTGLETVEVRPRVQGFIADIHFRAGSIVQAGDLLFTIDPRPFRARLAQARAELAGKEAALALASSNLEKAKQLSTRRVLAEQELDTRTAQYEQAVADVDLARANVEAASLDLSYTEVRAPIGGRISRNLVDRGALVGAGEPTVLATIVNDEQVYVYFDVTERQMLDSFRADPSLQRETAMTSRRPVFVARAGEDEYAYEGWIDSADNQLDPETGTLRVRAVLANPDRALVPGTFVRIRVPTSRVRAVLVPDLAVAADQAGRYVLVVDEANVVERRPVEVGALTDRLRAIESGLTGDEWVVVNGLQRARPGTPVSPQRSTVEAQLRGEEETG